MNIGEPGQHPEQDRPESDFLLFTAYAMARRIITEASHAQKIAHSLANEPYFEAPEGVNELLAFTSARQLVDLIEGWPPRTVDEYLEEAGATLSDEIILEMVFKDFYFVDDIDPAAVRTMCLTLAKNYRNLADKSDAVDVDKALLLYHKAKELAEIKGSGVTVESIFTDDSLYAELMRFTYTPVDLAHELIKSREGITTDTVADLIIKHELATRKAIATDEDSDLTDDEVLDLYAKKHEPEFQLIAVEQYGRMLDLHSKLFRVMLERYWGAGVVEGLPEDTQARLKSPFENI